MVPKSGNRFSDKIMLERTMSMVPKSGNRFSDKIMLKQKSERDPVVLNRKRALVPFIGRIFCGKPMPAFAKNAWRDARPWQPAGFS
jgi:hypothetical protein